MYCVKCGVKLVDTPEKCPLCGIPVWNPEGLANARPQFSEEMPSAGKNARRVIAAILTTAVIAAEFTVFIVSANLENGKNWAGYAMLGIALGFIVAVLPLWFNKYFPEVFVPVSHLAAGGYALYICIYTGGNWFMPFAFPIVLINCALLTAFLVLLKYIRRKQGYILGGFVMACGVFTVFVELFLHITFGFEMFSWSLYSLLACMAVGGFILLSEIIKPLNSFIKKNFFY